MERMRLREVSLPACKFTLLPTERRLPVGILLSVYAFEGVLKSFLDNMGERSVEGYAVDNVVRPGSS